MASATFTIGNISDTITVPASANATSNQVASAMVAGYILAYANTPNPVVLPENATATQTLRAVHVHHWRQFRRIAVQAIAKDAGRVAEAAKLAENEGDDWS